MMGREAQQASPAPTLQSVRHYFKKGAPNITLHILVSSGVNCVCKSDHQLERVCPGHVVVTDLTTR